MKRLVNRKWILVLLPLAVAVMVFTYSSRNTVVDFNTQVKPIFNKKCITCHGGIKQKSGFSLLFRNEALANNKSGKPAIVPGKPGESELIRRLSLKDPEERMPYKHDPLSKDEIKLLSRWIKQGAQWGDHWAYVSVKPTTAPDINDDWVKNDIDRFILNKLEEEDLQPSAEADKATLLRRVSLDIIGMPAPQTIAQQFLKDKTEKAYENLVDSLLASSHYGEKWAALWLDLARYADTKGYERDDSRSIWRYRDWLIKSFNEDKPYNLFLTEQLAGDLVPNASDDQLIATAFHRNTMTNDEGGTENEEFRTAAVLDRVNTTWETLMGTTFGCVQCHSHPYDPFKHEEYYKFMAFFNNSRDEDTEAEFPLLYHFPDSVMQQFNALQDWLKENTTPQNAASVMQFVKTRQPTINSLLADHFINSELSDTKWLAFRNHAVCRLKNVSLQDKNTLLYSYLSWPKGGGSWKIHIDSANGPVIADISFPTTKKQEGWKIGEANIKPVNGVHDLYFTYSDPKLKDPLFNSIMFEWFYFSQAFPGKDKPGYSSMKNTFWKLIRMQVPTTPVMMDNPPDMYRASHVFERGNWLVKGEEVHADVPHSLNPMPANAPKNRMGLAMWLTDTKNPLTARTMMNRLWEQLFGQGLAETLEDLGTQGIPPVHKELLDWLSYQFMHDQQWSVKRMLKMVTMSATYRQDAKTTPALLEKDPYNKLYARGARVRLSAEQVRDQALAASGLLSEKLYGPSVYPYQPSGIWLSPWNGNEWKKSEGEDQYRRALYTYWKRTAPYPSMMTFDGAAREVCTSRRIRTNTPLQALVTLNDEAYIEMARGLAYRMKREAGSDIKQCISKGYEWILYKQIDEARLQVFEKLYNQAINRFKKDKDMTCEMIGVMNEHNNPETAALVVVANAMLNLDEVVMKN